MHPNCEAVNDILQTAGLPGRVRMLDEAVTTARAAAQHLGCPVGAIANSLIFETFRAASVGIRPQLTKSDAGPPLLIMTSGAHRVDMTKVGQQQGVTLRRASPAFVREHTGQPIGGVAPSAIHGQSGRSSMARSPSSTSSGLPAAFRTPSFP